MPVRNRAIAAAVESREWICGGSQQRIARVVASGLFFSPAIVFTSGYVQWDQAFDVLSAVSYQV